MPMYEYRCQVCGRTYEQLRRMSDADRDLECPECQSREVERLVSGFAMGGCSPTPGGGFS
jgi:putative FmdB family regulatory protein